MDKLSRGLYFIVCSKGSEGNKNYKWFMYLRCWHEQPGVAERSDTDDRLRRALVANLQSMFVENM